MHLESLFVVSVLLLTATEVHSQQICYLLGFDCNWSFGSDGGGGGGVVVGGWLQAELQSQMRAEGPPNFATLCPCCCTEVPCNSSICGSPHVCPIVQCYAHILGKVSNWLHTTIM